ncbi:hypothetical protein Pelo_8131 [Pelomyxa schiedti]|nr:hypothetical protein Pelo_12187 [Pelomyxa schiedti]KAH3760055.1 hypothetical protein Pelo_8131 [Pelomyxa schiedti]
MMNEGGDAGEGDKSDSNENVDSDVENEGNGDDDDESVPPVIAAGRKKLEDLKKVMCYTAPQYAHVPLFLPTPEFLKYRVASDHFQTADSLRALSDTKLLMAAKGNNLALVDTSKKSSTEKWRCNCLMSVNSGHGYIVVCAWSGLLVESIETGERIIDTAAEIKPEFKAMNNGSAFFTKEGKLYLVVCTNSGKRAIRIISLPEANLVCDFQLPRAANCVSCSPDSVWIAAACDGAVSVVAPIATTFSPINLNMPPPVTLPRRMWSADPQYVTWSDDSTICSVSSENHCLYWWHVPDWNKPSSLSFPESLYNMQFLRGTHVIAVISRSFLRFVNTDTSTIVQQFSNFQGAITGISLTQTGKLFIGTETGVYQFTPGGIPSLLDLCMGSIRKNPKTWENTHWEDYLPEDLISRIFPKEGDEIIPVGGPTDEHGSSEGEEDDSDEDYVDDGTAGDDSDE